MDDRSKHESTGEIFYFPGSSGPGFLHPKNEAPDHDGSGHSQRARAVAVGECGDSIEVSIRVEEGAIAAIGVLPHGCVYTRLCAIALGDLARGRTLEYALELEPGDIADALGKLPGDHMHCARLALNTLHEAIADYYGKTVKQENGQAAEGAPERNRR